ncbi:histidine-containing phosphotransfer protein 1-like isoform X2 [Rhodamnia argentea]|uniref:Histidine-containing phosphotransfer protein n=1 Tax=Rhodamnia argentea TaxID=178133 RepID=A0ABM3GZL5_9MYRT|nr:histidine-containing phosphotransfer protein 1-like isoform X2 [Rhodamnia argentea]
MDAGLMQMQGRLDDYMNTLFNEEILDSQYLELHELQDESNPGFVVEVVSLFLTDAEKLLDELSRDLTQQNVDFKRAHAQAHKLMGSSCSIGAERVKNACIVFRNFCQEKNIPGCLRCLQQIKQEFLLVKSKLETLFKLEQQVVAAGGSIPTVQQPSL